MSLPEYRADILRYDWIEAEWVDQAGHRMQGEFQGIEAICIQHEVDHLKGVLFIDHVRFSKRDMIPRGK